MGTTQTPERTQSGAQNGAGCGGHRRAARAWATGIGGRKMARSFLCLMAPAAPFRLTARVLQRLHTKEINDVPLTLVVMNAQPDDRLNPALTPPSRARRTHNQQHGDRI
jgi:hypothetical protein